MVRRHPVHHVIKVVVIIRLLAIILIVGGLIDKSMLFLGWINSGFEFTSYHAAVPLIGLILASIYLFYLYLNYTDIRENIVLWITGISWIFLESVLFFVIWIRDGYLSTFISSLMI